MNIKKMFLLACLLLVFGCEKKAEVKDENTENTTQIEKTETILDLSSPIQSNPETIDIGSKDYDPEKIYSTYFSDDVDLNIGNNIEDVAVTKEFILLHKQFESEWKYWLYDGEELGIIVLKEKNLDTQETVLKDSIFKFKAGILRWKELLKKVNKICDLQASDESCT